MFSAGLKQLWTGNFRKIISENLEKNWQSRICRFVCQQDNSKERLFWLEC